MALFSKNIVNSKRQMELDILKVFTIFNMMFMHLQEFVFSHSYNDRSFIQNSWCLLFVCNAAYLAGPSSFMFSMGCTIPFSRNNNAKTNMRRGLGLLAMWLFVNSMRIIPIFFNTALIPSSLLPCFILINDVLFFAGAFFLFFGFMQAKNFSFPKIAFVFTVLFIMAQCVGNFGRFLPTWSHLPLAGIVWVGHWSSFPLLNWGFIVAIGISAGLLLQRCLNKTKLYAIIGIFGAVAVAVMLLLLSKAGALQTDILLQSASNPLSMHRANIISVTCALSCIALLISICHLLSFILPETIKCGISCVANKILSIYVAHWIILPWLAFIPWMHNGRAGAAKIVFVAFTLYVVSFCLIVGYEHLAAAIKGRKKSIPTT